MGDIITAAMHVTHPIGNALGVCCTACGHPQGNAGGRAWRPAFRTADGDGLHGACLYRACLAGAVRL